MSLLRIVQLNPVYTNALKDPAALLERYVTLTGWASALRQAGADVTVVQRFSTDAEVVCDAVRYVFSRDDGPPLPASHWTSPSLAARVARLDPDVVHVNGLMFHALTVTLRAVLPPSTAIVAQDHSGYSPAGHRRLQFGRRRRARNAFRALDACSFTDAAQAEPWRAAGWLHDTPVLSILESGTMMKPEPRDAARQSTGIHGSPAIVWIGRLDANKDPLTVLDALDLAFERLPEARAWMLYHVAPLEREVRVRIARSRRLADRVTLVGAVPHHRVASYLSAADLFVSGSHREGSGYALIEAMACGVVPVVTDIPSFRAIAGETGTRWRPGDAGACAAAIERAAACDLVAERDRVSRRFTSELSWTAIGAHTLALYSALVAQRRARL